MYESFISNLGETILDSKEMYKELFFEDKLTYGLDFNLNIDKLDNYCFTKYLGGVNA